MGHTASKVKGSIPFGRGNVFGNLPVGSDGNILAADSSGPSGVNWSSSLLTVGAGVGISGFWIYGTGADGNVTLVGNTTLAAGDSVKNYNNLTLAGFNLTFDSADFYAVVYVKDTLSGGGGDLTAENRGSGTLNAGGLGGIPPAGNGGAGAAAFYVFARNITTVVEVAASGKGGAAGGGSSIFLFGGASSEYSTSIVFKAKTYPSPVFTAPQGGFHFGVPGFGGGGDAPTVSAANRQEIERTATDWLRMVVMNGYSDYVASGAAPDERWSRSNGGGGGAAGLGPIGPGPSTPFMPGGGGGGGGTGIIGDPGGGGGATAVVVTLDVGEFASSGAGGGAGGGGGLVILVADTITAATFLSAAGGIGGAGSGGSGGIPTAPNGGGGGGGGGGYALAVVRIGVGFVSAIVVGGAGGGGPGTAGGTGFPGLAAVLAST